MWILAKLYVSCKRKICAMTVLGTCKITSMLLSEVLPHAQGFDSVMVGEITWGWNLRLLATGNVADVLLSESSRVRLRSFCVLHA